MGKTKLFHKDKPIAGIDISQTGIKAMAIDTKKWLVLGYGSIDLDPGKLDVSMKNGDDYLAQAIDELFRSKYTGSIPSNHVVISVPTSSTYSRSITLPRDAKKNLLDAVMLEVEQYIPVPRSELYIDYEITETIGKDMTIMLSAVPKRIVDTVLSACERAGLEVAMVEPGISSVARLLTNTEDGHLPTIIVDIGSSSSDIAVLDRFVRVSGGTPLGGNTFTLDISKKLKISLESAHQLKVLNGLNPSPKQAAIRGALEPSLRRIADEIQKMVRYYSERMGDKRIEQILIVGGGSNIPGLGDYFTDKLVMPVRVASPWQILNFGKLEQPSKQHKPRFITAAGLASVNPGDIWK